MIEEMVSYVTNLQDQICSVLGEAGAGNFSREEWNIPGKGYGLTRVTVNGPILEKGGVNFSRVEGEMPPQVASTLLSEPAPFVATGISLVLHPFSPRIPTIHMNLRYFEQINGRSWFGGGIDLTPYYPHEEDFVFFHRYLKDRMEEVLPGSYSQYKKWCDEYFYLKHRHEMRGIGGVFFDHLDGRDERHFRLVQAVGDAFIPIYLKIVEKRRGEQFTKEEKEFQLFRRGRYVEFNLLYDRGTRFGLEWGGRVESILMSLPLVVHFPYNWQPDQPHLKKMLGYYQPNEWA